MQKREGCHHAEIILDPDLHKLVEADPLVLHIPGAGIVSLHSVAQNPRVGA
jgi:hypothetical protein